VVTIIARRTARFLRAPEPRRPEMTVTETAPTEHLQPPVKETTVAPPADGGLIEEELLVEEISIDGMCGVY
jgi:mycofactocin precursor